MRASNSTYVVALALLAPVSDATVVTDDSAVADGTSFDFIIVGGGLSGLTVANKVLFY